jgi:hypothetical protein
MGLNKQVSTIQDMYYEFVRCRQWSIHVNDILSHRYVTAQQKEYKTQTTYKKNKKYKLDANPKSANPKSVICCRIHSSINVSKLQTHSQVCHFCSPICFFGIQFGFKMWFLSVNLVHKITNKIKEILGMRLWLWSLKWE